MVEIKQVSFKSNPLCTVQIVALANQVQLTPPPPLIQTFLTRIIPYFLVVRVACRSSYHCWDVWVRNCPLESYLGNFLGKLSGWELLERRGLSPCFTNQGWIITAWSYWIMIWGFLVVTINEMSFSQNFKVCLEIVHDVQHDTVFTEYILNIFQAKISSRCSSIVYVQGKPYVYTTEQAMFGYPAVAYSRQWCHLSRINSSNNY